MHTKAGLFSAVLTAFIIDRNQTIQPTPAQQSAFYQQQSVVLLNQISQQLSSLGAPIPDPSDSSLPGFALTASASDVRVNIIWIISLVLSLTAALLATLLRQWAQDHMRIFQLHRHPLKVARIRQYLYEGAMRGYIPTLAETVPGLVHISLLLFLAGLADFFLNTYPTVGRSTLSPIVICALLYIIFTIAPIMNPQFPYRTPCSSLVWYTTRKLWIRSRRCRFGISLPVPLLGSTMTEGQLQLAMERSDERKRRDEWAIRWLVDNVTYNAQDSELLALGIPGSLETTWGVEVWKAGSIYGEDKIYRDIGRLFGTCGDRASLTDDEWHVRSRACTEAIAVFVLFMDADISMIGNCWKLLSDIGRHGRTREVSGIRSNRTFAIRWTCLSLVAIRKMLNNSQLQQHADATLSNLCALYPEGNLGFTEMAPRNARRIDERFSAAWNHVERIRQVLTLSEEEDLTRGRIAEILRQDEPELTSILNEVESMEHGMDASLSKLQQQIDEVTHTLIQPLPGVAFDDITGSTTVERTIDFLANPVRPQLMYFSKLLGGLCGVNQEWCGQGLQDMVETLRSMETIPRSLSQSRLMEQQLWRLQDLKNGAFGFTLELYFLSIRQLLSTLSSRPRGIHPTVFVNTFKAITSDWREFTNSPGTLPIILNLVYDITFQDRGIFSNFKYPDYIAKELLDLLGWMMDGQAEAYIEAAMEGLLRGDLSVRDPGFCQKALMTIQRQAAHLAPG